MKQEIKILKILVVILIILNLGMSLANYKMQIETIALAKENENLENKVEIQQLVITELRKILINDYGSEKFWELIDKK